MVITKELLIKFSRSPKKCTEKELNDIEEYLLIYKQHQEVFKEAMNSEPLGFTLDSYLDKVKWYQDNK